MLFIAPSAIGDTVGAPVVLGYPLFPTLDVPIGCFCSMFPMGLLAGLSVAKLNQ